MKKPYIIKQIDWVYPKTRTQSEVCVCNNFEKKNYYEKRTSPGCLKWRYPQSMMYKKVTFKNEFPMA